jgi:hypothetical protein
MEYFLTWIAYYLFGKMMSDVHANSQAEAWRRQKEKRNVR